MSTVPSESQKRQRLRDLLALPGIVVLPGVYDALGARIAASIGFEAIHMTGYGVSASLLGEPDIGLATLTEMAACAARLAAVSHVPLLADADAGYGSTINVRRTMREYERAGVAGLHIEDQVTPKRCGMTGRKELLACDDMVAKVRAAVMARSDPDLVLVARTDARDVTGLDDAIARATAYAEAGADAIFVEGPRTADEISRIAAALRPVPLVHNVGTLDTADGSPPSVELSYLERWGYKMVLFPVQALYAAAYATRKVLTHLHEHGAVADALSTTFTSDDLNQSTGLPDWSEFEAEASATNRADQSASDARTRPR
jgi:2-methylisocitrate lyase-like PEP mutase family enzyme